MFPLLNNPILSSYRSCAGILDPGHRALPTPSEKQGPAQGMRGHPIRMNSWAQLYNPPTESCCPSPQDQGNQLPLC